MCDEREPLLAYLYDEADPAERRRVEAHLQSCETCRDELAGLRQVREDLLAWDVPDHGSVWQPFTPSRPAWSWRDVPAWSLAAAAAVILTLGATGGLVGDHWMRLSHLAPVMEAAVVPVPPLMAKRAAPGVTVTPADLTALEARVTKALQERTKPVPVPNQPTVSDYNRLLDIIAEQQGAVAILTKRLNDLSATVTQMQSQQQGGR